MPRSPAANPRAIGRVMAEGKPSPIVARLPAKLDIAAFTPPEAFEKWHAGVQAAGDIGANVITMYDVIGADYWTGGGVTLKRVDAALRSIGAQDVEVHINSPGGDMFEGIAIYNRLLEHPAKVSVKVFGLAASAASIIAMAGAERLVAPAAFLMIHNCWVLAAGNRHDMAEVAQFLEPFDAAMAGVYADTSGSKLADCAKWMDAETWMGGAMAQERGFATGTLSADDMKEDPAVSEQARASNALRQAEIALCRSGSTRAEARALLNKIKGTPGAAQDDRTPGAADLSWLGAAAELTQNISS
jgi:ATP-dependent Clp protease protease subunit